MCKQRVRWQSTSGRPFKFKDNLRVDFWTAPYSFYPVNNKITRYHLEYERLKSISLRELLSLFIVNIAIRILTVLLL